MFGFDNPLEYQRDKRVFVCKGEKFGEPTACNIVSAFICRKQIYEISSILAGDDKSISILSSHVLQFDRIIIPVKLYPFPISRHSSLQHGTDDQR